MLNVGWQLVFQDVEYFFNWHLKRQQGLLRVVSGADDERALDVAELYEFICHTLTVC